MNIPRTIRVIQCTETTYHSYEEFIGITLGVMEASSDYYFVDEYNMRLGWCIQIQIKKSDCEIVEY